MSWWLRFHRRSRLERDLADEVSFHREMRSHDRNPPPFGNETQIRERMRELWTFGWLESTGSDLAFAPRSWRRNPAFALTVVASLALAIGAVIAIFTAADDLLFRPLPYGDPGKLVMLWEANRSASKTSREVVSPDNFLDWKTHNSVFEDMAFVDEGQSVFSDGNRSEELRVQRIPPDFFDTLKVQPFLGHLGNALVSSGDSENNVVISYRLWKSWFGGDHHVIGQSVQLDSFAKTVSGVMAPGFSFGDRDVDLWPYMRIYPSAPHDRGARSMRVVARLKNGVELSAARAQMETIGLQLEREDPQFNKNWTVTVENLRDAFTNKVKSSLLVLLASVSLLLLVACANAANLMLARFFARRPEMAMRAALGAGRGRLTRQLLTESLLLAACSGVAGLALGRLALAGLLVIAPKSITQITEVSIDWRSVVFAVGLSALTGIVFGLVPSLLGAALGSDVEAKSLSGWRTLGRRSPRAWLVASEIALSVVLLAGGTLLCRSLLKLQHVDSGLAPHNILTFHFRVMSPGDVGRFAQTITQLKNVPGVHSVSATSFLPFDGVAASARVTISGHASSRPGQEPTAMVRTVMPGYFQTIGIPIRRGREFNQGDNTPQSPLRFVVNESFMRDFVRGEDFQNRSVSVGMARSNPLGQIVGVVGDVKEGALDRSPVPTVYYVYSHMPYGQMTLVVRTERDPMALVMSARKVMREMDPKLAMANIQTMDDILGYTLSRERFLALLLAGFSVSAILVAAIGIYGVLGYSISLRTQEIGIRQAVGADATRIVRMILAEGAWFVTAGLLAGTAAAFGLTRLLSGLLFETPTNDPVAFTLAAAILMAAAMIAAYIPARRAALLDPMRALRSE